MIKSIINRCVPFFLKKKLKALIAKTRWKGSDKIFCISMQRCGTTSVGNFFIHFGYQVARSSHSRKNNWSTHWYNGNFEAIFNSVDFKSFQVFEDDPWWSPEFYKVLFHRFPNSKFILFTRDSESWYQSMNSHSKGKTLGNTKLHCKLYRREKEFYDKFKVKTVLNTNDNLLSLNEYKQHYKNLFETRNKEIFNFFEEHNSGRLIHCELNDLNKWHKLGKFFNINVPNEFNIHSNKSES